MKEKPLSPTIKSKPSPPELEKLDLDPDAWPEFEALVKSAAKMGHKPHDGNLAKRLECDDDQGRFEAKLGKLAKATPNPAKKNG